MIPKVVHFVWLGGAPKPPIVQMCIESWRRFCPGWEIREWGDGSLEGVGNRYLCEAVEHRKWAFAADYLRLKILNDHGGFYLDTDLELMKPIDEFCGCDFVTGFIDRPPNVFLNMCFLGAAKGNVRIADMLAEYERISFVGLDGELDQTPNVVRFARYFASRGFDFSDAHATVELSPTERICPVECFNSRDGYAFHHYAASWLDDWTRKVWLRCGRWKLVRFKRRLEVTSQTPVLMKDEKIVLSIALGRRKRISIVRGKKEDGERKGRTRLTANVFALVFLAIIAGFCPLVVKNSSLVSASGYIEEFPLKRMFVELNGGMSRLIGRRLCNTIYRSTEGVLLSESFGPNEIRLEAEVEAVSAFVNWLRECGVPYVYIQTPAKIDMERKMLPDCFVHNGNEKADAMLKSLGKLGVTTIDLRAMITESSEDVVRYFYKTDHHWNNDAVFKVFGVLSSRIAEVTACDRSVIAPFVSSNAWERQIWKQCFLGSGARRTGSIFGGRDDLVVYVPRFHTDMEIKIPTKGIRLSGDFRKTVMWHSGDILRRKGNEFRRDAYSLLYVGGIYGVVRHVNNRAPLHKRIVIVGDSYVRPLEALLSTVVSDILVLDQRRFGANETVAGFVRQYKPDLVLQICNPLALGVSQTGHSAFFEFGDLGNPCFSRL